MNNLEKIKQQLKSLHDILILKANKYEGARRRIKVTVKRNGKEFQQYRWVGSDKPEKPKPIKQVKQNQKPKPKPTPIKLENTGESWEPNKHSALDRFLNNEAFKTFNLSKRERSLFDGIEESFNKRFEKTNLTIFKQKKYAKKPVAVEFIGFRELELGEKGHIDAKDFDDGYYNAPRDNYNFQFTYDEIRVNGKKYNHDVIQLWKDYKGRSFDTYQSISLPFYKQINYPNNQMGIIFTQIAENREKNLPPETKPTPIPKDSLKPIKTPKKKQAELSKLNTAMRKKLAETIGLKLRPAPFKNWIKEGKIPKQEKKGNYYGFSDSALIPIAEAKDQKIGWNNLILDPNIKKAPYIFIAPSDPIIQDISSKGHTPYQDVLAADNITALYKLAVSNNIANLGYGIFAIDTKNKTIEKMDIHALNNTTLEEANKEADKLGKDNFLQKPEPTTKGQPIETDKNKPTPTSINTTTLPGAKTTSLPEAEVEKKARNIANKIVGMNIKGKKATTKDSDDFYQKYSIPLSNQYEAIGASWGSKIKNPQSYYASDKQKADLIKKLEKGVKESSIKDDTTDDFFLKLLLHKKFLKAEKEGYNTETGYPKYVYYIKDEHKLGLELYANLISG